MSNYYFWSSWDSKEQIMHFGSLNNVDYAVSVSIKEYKSECTLWSNEYDKLNQGIQYWINPISKNSHDYENDPNFSGVKICIYKKETGEQIYEHPYFFKFVNIPRVSLSNTIPYNFNYKEFFIENKYKNYFSKKYNNVVDVGANIGIFTEYLIRNEITDRIIAIECDPLALKDLKNNFNREPKVEIISKALSHSNDPITFYSSKENPVISSTIHPDKLTNHSVGLKGDIQTIVETTTIKYLVDKLQTIDLLKIDIEGGEYDIINKLDPSLFNKINNFFIECHFFEEDYLIKYNNLISKLIYGGYEVSEYLENQSVLYKGGSEIIFASKK